MKSSYRFMSEVTVKYGFKHIGIESVSERSRAFVEKLGSHSIDNNYAVSVENLISYFSNG